MQAKNWTYPLMRSTKMSRMGASKGSASLGSSHVLYGDVCLIPLSYLGIKSPQFGCQLSLGSNKIWSRWNLNPPAWIGNITRKTMSTSSDPFVDGSNDNAGRQALRRRIHAELSSDLDANHARLSTPENSNVSEMAR